MKKLNNTLFIGLCLLVFASCAKDEIPEQKDENNITLYFAPIVVDSSTKATLNPNSDETAFDASWELTDEIGICSFNGETIDVDNVNGKWNGTAFNTAFTGVEGLTKSFVGIYPYNEEGVIEFGSARVQSGNAYNSTYDVMKSDKVTTTLTNDATIALSMHRETAIAYFHLTGTPTEGETVQSATLTIDAGEATPAKIAGEIIYDGGEIVTEGTSNSITITFADDSNPSADDFKLWFNVLPVLYKTLTLEVSTEHYTMIINNAKGGSYEAGKLYKVSANASSKWEENGGDTPVAPTYGYVKVTSAPTDWSGEYLIADGNKVFNGLDAASDFVEGTISNNVLEYIDGMAKISIEKMEGGYSLKILNGDKAGNYISGKSGNNTIVFNDNVVANEITINDDGLATILSNSTSFRFNATSGQERFRYFKTTTTGDLYHVPALYRYQEIIPVEKVHVESVAIDETLNLKVGDTHTLVANVFPNNATDKRITWKSDNEDVATVENGVVTAAGVGNATITVTTVDGGFAGICKVTVISPSTTTVTKSISEISGTTSDGTKVSSMSLNSDITATASTNGNNGKVYSSGTQWRFYQNDKGTLTISTSGSHELVSIKITFTSDKTGTLLLDKTVMTSNTSYDVSGKSATLTLGNSTASTTNGQIRITEIEVSYK